MTNLGSIAWGSGPNITGSIAYEYQRSGADMQYRVQITVNTLPYSSSYFGFPIYASIKLDGSSKASATIKNASPSQWSSALVYTSGWLTVSGKSSGTTSLSVNIYSGSGESRDYTYSYSLYVVPAASTMTVPAITLGSAATLTITPAASGLGYKHTITYKFGSASGTVVSSTSSTSVSWTAPLSLANQIPNSTSGVGTLTLDTYSGSTKIGSRDYTFTATAPDSVKPSVSSAALSDSMGYFTTFSAYVQNKSKLKVVITATQSYGSAIKSYTVVVGDKTTTATTNEVTVDLLSAGTIPVIVRVTDGRGRVSTDYTTTITVLPYAAPQITAMTASRCRNDGTPDPTGTYVNVVFSGAISALNNRNTAVWKVGRKKPTDEYWTETTVTVSQKYAPNSVSTIISGVAANSPYIFRISATDTVTGTVTSVEIPVPAGYAFFRTNANLDGLSFGKEEVKPNTLGVAWDTECDKKLIVAGTPISTPDTGSDGGAAMHASSVKRFAAEMQRKAAGIGMHDTTIVTPSGYPTTGASVSAASSRNNRMTARDLLRLLVAARHSPTVYKSMGQETYGYRKNGTEVTITHSILNSGVWKTWAAENGYTVLAAKGGSLTGSISEMSGGSLLNMGAIIGYGSDVYACAVVGLGYTDDDKVLDRTLIHDMIEHLKGAPITSAITDAIGRANRVGLAAARLADGGYDADIEALENGYYGDYTAEGQTAYSADIVYVAASTSKILCAIVAAEMSHGNMTFTAEDLIDGSGETWEAGDVVSIADAITVMMMRSDNRCATLLARYGGRQMASGGVKTVYGGTVDIPYGADLNDYQTPGVYNIASNTIAASLRNAPSTVAGILIVEALGAASWIRQTYIPAVQSCTEYKRYKTNAWRTYGPTT